MKVNISGKGIVPGLNRLAPVYNCDLSKSAVLRLLNFPKFHVYETATGTYISKSNVDAVFAKTTTDTKLKVDAPLPKKQKAVETKVVKKEEVPVRPVEEVKFETPEHTPYIVEPTEEETVSTVSEETTVEEKVDPVVEEPLPEIDVISEESQERKNELLDALNEADEVTEEAVEETGEETTEEPKAYYNKKKNKKKHN